MGGYSVRFTSSSSIVEILRPLFASQYNSFVSVVFDQPFIPFNLLHQSPLYFSHTPTIPPPPPPASPLKRLVLQLHVAYIYLVRCYHFHSLNFAQLFYLCSILTVASTVSIPFPPLKHHYYTTTHTTTEFTHFLSSLSSYSSYICVDNRPLCSTSHSTAYKFQFTH